MNRIAPNNTLPATHFIEVWNDKRNSQKVILLKEDCFNIIHLLKHLKATKKIASLKTIAIFRIRENKLPTLHNFNK